MNIKLKAITFAVLLATQAFPLVASAQYGGGGPIGFIAVPATPSASPQDTHPQGQVLGATAYTFLKNLRRGSTGRDVVELQKILIAAGYLKLDQPSGFFGAATEAALRTYQGAHGIEGIGTAGPLTRSVLNKGIAPTISDEQKSLLIQQLQSKFKDLMAKFQGLLALSAST
jgi:peptidoglycan hydrolase-like protein with peptidoglycan-binding domain